MGDDSHMDALARHNAGNAEPMARANITTDNRPTGAADSDVFTAAAVTARDVAESTGISRACAGLFTAAASADDSAHFFSTRYCRATGAGHVAA